MATENSLWGAPRIHGELLKLGIEISERTVSRYMPQGRTPRSQTWRTFLSNHLGNVAVLDFPAIPTLRCQILCWFLAASQGRQRADHLDVAPVKARPIIEAFRSETGSYLWLWNCETVSDVGCGWVTKPGILLREIVSHRARMHPRLCNGPPDRERLQLAAGRLAAQLRAGADDLDRWNHQRAA